MISSVLKTEVAVQNVEEGRSIIKRRLCHKKVLVVLDDVDDLKQIEALAGSHDWFGEGSRIIITTRNEHLLNRKADSIYGVSLLSHDEAIKLFHAHAYRKDKPVEDYEKLSEKVVSYAGGLPLALEVLGSYLYDKDDQDEWMSALDKLKDIPHHNEKTEKKAIKVLKACNFNPVRGVRVLVQRSLIYESNGEFDMHDLIEEMAHDIVSEEHPEKHSRVWKSEDLLHICAMDATKVIVMLPLQDICYKLHKH
ncbi:Toll/interleukin-1 receptor domain-containing protein [Tanacetum coccineum]